MERAQVAYSRRLDENQNAALARKEASAVAAGRAYTQTHAAPSIRTETLPDYSAFFWIFVIFFGLPALFGGGLLYAIIQRQKRPAQPQKPAQPQSGHYAAATSLLTPTEARFHAVLAEAVGPMATIQCKVRLADLLTTRRGDYASFNRVSQKHVDFVLCDRVTLRPLVAVELDDPSHDRADRQERDRFVNAACAQAGLPLVHVRTAASYSPAALLSQLQPFLLS